MRVLAKELGPRGIRVNAVCPGWVRTRAALPSLRDVSVRAGVEEESMLDDILSAQALPGLMEPVTSPAPTCSSPPGLPPMSPAKPGTSTAARSWHDGRHGMMGSLACKRAVVTGAASGIGRAIAVALTAEGARVVLADRASCADTEAAIRNAGGEAASVPTDVSSEAEVRKLFEAVESRLAGSISWSTMPAS